MLSQCFYVGYLCPLRQYLYDDMTNQHQKKRNPSGTYLDRTLLNTCKNA
jgi:hypothetical protein